MSPSPAELRDLALRTLTVSAVVLVVGLVIALVWYALDLLILLFAGLLLSVLLRGLGEALEAALGLSRPLALLTVILILTTGLVGGGLALGPAVFAEGADLITQLSEAVRAGLAELRTLPYGDRLLEALRGSIERIADLATVARIGDVFTGALGIGVRLFVVLASGVYFAFEPGLYAGGILKLVPESAQTLVDELLDATRQMLRWWLLGRILAMVLVGLLVAGGLLLLGVPRPAALGVIAAVLEFVPLVGPTLAYVPAALVGLTVSPYHPLYLVVLFLAVQGLEGFLITPIVQERAISMPPALTIASQVLLGLIAGGLGVVLATPLLAVLVIGVQILYVREVLGKEVDLLGT